MLRENIQEENFPELPEGSRAPTYDFVYKGGFKDRNQDIQTAGILSYAPGENVREYLKYQPFSAPSQTRDTVERFYNYNKHPKLAETRVHYGRANDPKDYLDLTHGLHSDEKSYKAKDCVNPKLLNRAESLKLDMSESVYKSKKTMPLGKIPFINLPKHIEPYQDTFGKPLDYSENAKTCINPDKSRKEVELNATDKHDWYVFSHSDYEPGERKNRQYAKPYNVDTRFGLQTGAVDDGKKAKESCLWLPQTLLEKRFEANSLLLDEFREKNTPQIGKTLDPNRDTRFLGADHTFGRLNTSEPFGAGDVLHDRCLVNTLKGKERDRAFLASARSFICGHNYTKYKTLVDAFKAYDKDKDSFISKEELKVGCAAAKYAIADDLLELLLNDCDYDGDGRLNFLEFVNFLCFKDSMKTGIELNPLVERTDRAIYDDEGRYLLRECELVPKNNISVNELVPYTISKQIDGKIGNWKTTYDIINEAPYRPEPQKKRVYGVASIRNDLVAPSYKKVMDRKNYGNDGNIWSIVSPSVFTQHGVYEKDVLKPRSKEELKIIFKNIGYDLSNDLFEQLWSSIESKNPYGVVSVEEFRNALAKVDSEKVFKQQSQVAV